MKKSLKSYYFKIEINHKFVSFLNFSKNLECLGNLVLYPAN